MLAITDRQARRTIAQKVSHFMSICSTENLQSVQMEKKKGQARADDTTKIKTRILEHLSVDGSPIEPMLTSLQKDKSGRGWAHPYFAKLLLPINLTPDDV